MTATGYSDPIPDPLNFVSYDRMFPTDEHPESLPPYGEDESGLRRRGSMIQDSYHQASSTTVTARTPKSEMLEDGSIQPTLSSEFVVADTDAARNETFIRSRAPPLFSARPPKSCSESKQDIRPTDICSLSPSSDAPPVNMPKPTVSTDPRETPVQSLSNSFKLSHEKHPYQFTPPISTSPDFSNIASDATRLAAPLPLTGVFVDGRPALPTNLKWADEAKKTRRTTPSQKR